MATINGKLRVACLYRVSTKGQVEQDDIPMQRRACREFIEKQDNWVIVKEYVELGISGFKKSAKKRDELQRAMSDAEDKLFDVILVFMFDRLGRKEDETPFIVEWFVKKGVQVWSVKEGQQEFNNHVDKLMNYIRFWQSSGESEKTSIRVNEKHTQMAKDGLYRGGTPPYGYTHVKSGMVNKKGKELVKLAINEDEATIVKEIFDMVYELGYGSNRIAKALNERGIKTRTGVEWSTATLNTMLKNPIYKGYMAYGKRSSKDGSFINQSRDEWVLSNEQIEELVIIPEEIWGRVQEIRTSRNPENVKREDVESVGVTKSPLLLVGLTRCGHCGFAMTTTYNYKKWTTADGTTKKKLRAKYRCSGKALNRVECNGQTIYSQEKIEGLVLEELDNYLDQLAKVDFTAKINKKKKEDLSQDSEKVKSLQKKLEETYEEISALNSEVPKAIMGKSSFKPELLNNLIQEKEKEITLLGQELREHEMKLKSKKSEISNLEDLQKTIPVWKETFKQAPLDKKKMMLSQIIESVVVYKNRVNIEVKLAIESFISSANGVQKQMSGESATLAV